MSGPQRGQRSGGDRGGRGGRDGGRGAEKSQYVERVVALGGPVAEQPRLLRTRLGANLQELTAGELKPGFNRVISGSVFGGRTAQGAFAFLGRYHNQVSCLSERRERRTGLDRGLEHGLGLEVEVGGW